MLSLLHVEDGMGLSVRPEEVADRLSVALQWDRVCTAESFWQTFAVRPYHILLVSAERVIAEGWREKIQEMQPGCQIVLLFHTEPLPSLLALMGLGVAELIPGSLSAEELTARVADICLRVLRQRESQRFSSLPACCAVGDGMRGLRIALSRIQRSSVSSILVTGESGTGKEQVASLLQSLLSSHMPFLPLNCAAMPEALLEAELFGYEKGAFTGAAAKRCGILAKAHRGWIFLDEVACLSLSAQAALLRVLETGEVRAIGGYLPKTYQIRVLAATNEDLDRLVAQGRFRNDLLQRLRGYEIHLPPFRARGKGEREEILDHLLLRLHRECSHTSGSPYALAPEVRNLILMLPWRNGNIREIWNTLRAMTVATESALLTFGCLPTRFLETLLLCGEPLDHASMDPLVGFSPLSPLRSGA